MKPPNSSKEWKTLSYLCLASGLISQIFNFMGLSSLLGIVLYGYTWMKYRQRNLWMTIGLAASVFSLFVFVYASWKRGSL